MISGVIKLYKRICTLFSLGCIVVAHIKGCDSNFEVKCSNYSFSTKETTTNQKIMSVKLLFIVIIDFKPYPSTYCLMQGSCFIRRNF